MGRKASEIPGPGGIPVGFGGAFHFPLTPGMVLVTMIPVASIKR